MKSLKGQLLVASKKLYDPNFFRTVLLMVQHSEEGALGLVLNRPLQITIQAAWPQISDNPCMAEGDLHEGGPCEGPLMVVHTHPELSQLDIIEGLYFSTEKGSIEKLVADDRGPMKFFVGYSGWSPGQLEGELDEGGWLVAPAAVQQIFTTGDEQWKAVMHAIDRAEAETWLDPKIIPNDPSMN